MRRAFVVCMVLCLAATAALAAGKVYWQADGVLVTGTDGMGIGDLVTDMRGGAYVLTGDLTRVYLIRVDKEGNLPWGLGGVLVDVAPGSALLYKTYGASDGRKGAILVWSWQYAWGTNLYYQRVDSLGNKTWGSSGQRLTLSDSTQEYWQVVGDGQGGAVVAWQERRGGQWDIYAQRVDSLGVRQWGDYGKGVCTSSNTQESIALTCDTNGNSVIAWADYRATQPQIYMDRFNDLGQSQWQVNGKCPCPTDSGQGLPGYGNAAVYATTGDILIAWHDRRNGNNDVYAQGMDIAGSQIWSLQGVAVCDTLNTQGSGQVVPDDRGGFIVCWMDRRNGQYNLYAQLVDSDGAAKWQRQGVPVCLSDNVYWYHRMVSDGNSGAIVCWQDERNGNYDIYVQHVDSAGNMLWQANGMPVCAVALTQEYPKMIESDSGTAIIAWDDWRNNMGRGYAQRVGDDGSGVTNNEVAKLLVTGLKLFGNRPNPFRQKTTIRYQITEPGRVSLKVYNAVGQCVRDLTPPLPPSPRGEGSGVRSVTWDGRDDGGKNTTNGVYICRLRMENGLTRSIKLIKLH